MDIDFNKLVHLLKTATQAAYLNLETFTRNDRIFAFALTTIDSASYINCCANTFGNMKKMLAENNIQSHDADSNFYKWSPCEWGRLEQISPDLFAEVDDYLEQIYLSIEERQLEMFRESVFKAMIAALKALKQEGLFDGNSSLTLFISIYESHESDKWERLSSRELNSESICEKYQQEYFGIATEV